jgi:hypothetical protein
LKLFKTEYPVQKGGGSTNASRISAKRPSESIGFGWETEFVCCHFLIVAEPDRVALLGILDTIKRKKEEEARAKEEKLK